MSKSSFVRWAVVYAGIIAIINILYFAIPYDHPDSLLWWIIYSFEMLSLLFFAYTLYESFSHKSAISKVYGWPIFKTGFIYASIQTFFTVLFTIIEALISKSGSATIQLWIPSVLSSILFIVAIIGLMVTKESKDHVEKIDKITDNDSPDLTFMKQFRNDMEILENSCDNSILKNRIASLSEKAKYSDPVSSQDVLTIEDKICQKIILLKSDVSKNDVNECLEEIKEIERLLDERNTFVKAEKKH
jgi:uncharacterized membrane protein